MSQGTQRAQSPRTLRWSKAAYHRLAQQGWLDDVRTELIDGEILEMPPPRPEHCRGFEAANEVLRDIFPRSAYWVRTQLPLDCGLTSEPQPDVAVVAGPFRTHFANSTTALLVVEVSDSTLYFDQHRKMSLYAAADIQEYWIINVPDRVLEVYRRPVPDPTAEFGHPYASRTVLSVSDTVSPLAAPHAVVAVADLLPA
jgi:Uma2 family endonuclease